MTMFGKNGRLAPKKDDNWLEVVDSISGLHGMIHKGNIRQHSRKKSIGSTNA